MCNVIRYNDYNIKVFCLWIHNPTKMNFGLQDKGAFAEILRRISKIQKNNGPGPSHVVLRDKWEIGYNNNNGKSFLKPFTWNDMLQLLLIMLFPPICLFCFSNFWWIYSVVHIIVDFPILNIHWKPLTWVGLWSRTDLYYQYINCR